MNIYIEKSDRIREAIRRRTELLRMYTDEMPTDYQDQLREQDRVIAAAVSNAYTRASRGW